MEKLYYRLCKSLADKGSILPINENYYDKINQEQDNYKSVFYYNESQLKQITTNNSVAGITEVISNKLYWDFDNESNINEAKTQAIDLINKLSKYFSNIQIYFSGSKGFEVCVELDNFYPVSTIKNICLNLAGEYSTLDSQIYNASRIMRIPLTKHQKTGAYKIPLTIEDLTNLTVEDIKREAKDISNFNSKTLLKIFEKKEVLPKELEQLPQKEIKEVITKTINYNLETIDWTLKPSYLSGAKWLVELGFFEEGERSTAAMILASTYKSLGYDENKAYYNIKAAMLAQAERTNGDKFPKKELWNNVIKQVYSNLWLGGTYSEKDTPLLARLAQHVPREIVNAKNDVLTIDQVGEKFNVFVRDIDKNLLQFGIPSLDNNLDAMIGRVYIIAGSPGCGKTTSLLQIMNNTSKKDIHSMFFSFDMSVEDVNQKLIQKHFKLTAKQIFELSKVPGKLKEFNQKLQEEYGNVFFIDSSGMTKEIMENRILTTEKNLGVNIKLIAVDYLDLVQADFSDPTQKSMAVIQGLKEIATKHRKCVLVLSQPNKANQKINESVSSYAAIKGSSAVAELANAVLWVYRPGAQPGNFENDRYYSIDCLKNRHGAMFSVDLAWNGAIGEVRELTPIEKVKLEQFRQELKESKKDEENDWKAF